MRKTIRYFFLVFIFFDKGSAQNILINEVMYNPTGNLQNTFEFVELYNTSYSDTIDLQGWYIRTDLNNSLSNPVWGDDEIVAWESRNPGTNPYDLALNNIPFVTNTTKIPPGYIAIILDATHNSLGYANYDFPDSAIILTLKMNKNFGSDQQTSQVNAVNNGLLYNSEDVVMIYNSNPTNTQSVLMDSVAWKNNYQTENFSLQKDDDCIFRWHTLASYNNTGGYDKDSDTSLLLPFSPGLHNYNQIIPEIISQDTLCIGNKFDFSIQLCGKHFLVWNFDDIGSGSANIDSSGDQAQHLFSYYGDFNVTATVEYGNFQGIVSKKIYVAPLPDFDLGNDTSICDKDNLLLKADNGISYLWNDGSANSSLMVQSPGTYYVEVKNQYGCNAYDTIQIQNYISPVVSLGNDLSLCDNTIVILDAGLFESYLWSDNSVTQSIQPSTTGVYSVEVKDKNGCKASDTVMVSVFAVPVIDLGNDTSFCSGNNLVITAPASYDKYEWTNGSTNDSIQVSTSGTYSLTVTDSNECQSKDSVFAEEIPTPLVSFIVNNVCEGNPIAFQNNSSSGSYLWKLGDGNTLNDSNPTYTYTQAGNYNVVLLVESNGCVDSLQTNLMVYAKPLPGFKADVVSGCMPLEVQFTDTTLNSKQYKWEFGDGKISIKSDPLHTYKDSGNYSVNLTVVSTEGCSAKITVADMIDVYPLPKANFELDKSELNITQPDLSCKNTSSGAITFYWYFSDGTVVIDNNPLHTFNDTGLYMIKQVVESQYGCLDSMEKSIKVIRDYNLFIPNTFTPNNDGLNDVFLPQGVGLRLYEYSLKVYTRWGDVLFVSNNPKEGWDGTINNKPVQDGNYLWQINISDKKNELVKNFSGLVSLIK
jgi:gliding motility-associated-like protein